MVPFTKQAIVRTFMLLLDERPLDKITVTDIVEKCGINRNTFYYYYQDIYALIDELFQDETKKILDDTKDYDTWQEGFLQAIRFARENRRAVYHIYNSINRDYLEKHLYDVTRHRMAQYVSRQAAGLGGCGEDLDAITEFFTAALVGIVMKWLRDGMREDLEPLVDRLGRLLGGSISEALVKAGAAGEHRCGCA